MKKVFLFTLLFIFTAVANGYAQGKVLVTAAKATRATVAKGAVMPKPLPPLPGTFVQPAFAQTGVAAATAELPAQAAVSAAQAASISPVVTAPKAERSVLEQIQRDLKAKKLKELHAQQVALAQAKENLPKLQENEAFFTADLTPYAPDHEIRAEQIELPAIREPGILYRGLALDSQGNSVANILENGLRVEDAGDESTTLITAYASHSQVASHVVATANRKVTNLTDSPRGAVYWLYKRLSANLQMPVLVQVTGIERSGSLVVETEDIPAENLTVFAKLKINDHARWCKIERTSNDEGLVGFKVTPFEYVLKAE